ncbi:hypothetical protein [Priestia flexa]|uniref:hypothetical protein n=1 Tax=Priestia flexa TaxID=86664 RepID=UPI0004743352|nr:hypothetical protein [Priestia flexa]
MAITIKENQKLCMKCEKVKTKSHFYKSMSEWHGDSTFPYCKHCVKGLVNLDDEYAIHTFLIQLDRPFLSDLWEKAVNDDKETLGRYLAFFNVGGDKNKRYKDGEIYGIVNNEVSHSDNPESVTQIKVSENFKVSPEMKKKWGESWNDGDIHYLEDFYDEYKNTYSTDTPAQRNLYRNIAIIHLQAEKQLTDGHLKQYKELMELSSKLHNDGNIKPVQSTGANEDKGLSTYGLWIKEVEREEPCEFFENKKIYEDADDLKKYLDKWFVRPFKNIFNLSKDFDVKD